MTKRKCSRCRQPHSGPKKTCARCLAWVAALRASRVAAGRCASFGCGAAAEPGVQTCALHRAHNAATCRLRRARLGIRPWPREPATVDLLDDYDAIL